VAEQSVLALFAERRRQIAEGIEADESELDEDGNRVPLKRHSYTREHKLAAVTDSVNGGPVMRQ
jgi:hypothetical protein